MLIVHYADNNRCFPSPNITNNTFMKTPFLVCIVRVHMRPWLGAWKLTEIVAGTNNYIRVSSVGYDYSSMPLMPLTVVQQNSRLIYAWMSNYIHCFMFMYSHVVSYPCPNHVAALAESSLHFDNSKYIQTSISYNVGCLYLISCPIMPYKKWFQNIWFCNITCEYQPNICCVNFLAC